MAQSHHKNSEVLGYLQIALGDFMPKKIKKSNTK
jgi:hypothetical protein